MRAAPTDLALSVWAKVSDPTDAPPMRLLVEFYEGESPADSTFIVGPPIDLTTSYQQHTLSGTVPDSPNPGGLPTRFMRAYLEIDRIGSGAGTIYDIDDWTLELTP